MIFKLLNEHHLEFLSLKGGCRGLSESTHVKMAYCRKSHAIAQFTPLGLIRLNISCESSAARRFTRNVQPNFLLKRNVILYTSMFLL